MMKTAIQYIFVTAAVMAPLAAVAQDLTKEITVDRTVVPKEREAQRPTGVNPTVIAPPVQTKRLKAAEYTTPGELTPAISTLPAAPWPSAVGRTPYRGYASIGYFPMFNLGANAGYRFIDDEATSVGAWMQYSGCSYKGNDVNEFKFKKNYATVGANGWHRFGKRSVLSAKADYTLAMIGMPYGAPISDMILPEPSALSTYNQTAHDFNLSARWSSAAGPVVYHLGGDVEAFRFTKLDYGCVSPMKPRHQTQAGFDGSVGLCRQGDIAPWLDLDFDGAFLFSNNNDYLSSDPYMPVMTEGNMGELHFAPHVSYSTADFTLRAGAKANVGTGYEGSFHVSPDVVLSYNPTASPFAAFVSATGGDELMPIARMFELDPYISAMRVFDRYRVPFHFEGGITVGPFSGLSLGVFGGYAQAKSWQMPFGNTYSTSYNANYEAADVKGWHLGVKADFAYDRYFALSLKAETASSSTDDTDKGWYLWRDRAKWAFAARLTVTPIDPLKIELDYYARTGRKELGASPLGMGTTILHYNLGNISDLTLGVHYQITEAFTVFARGENLLNHRYELTAGLPAQGIHGLVGVAVKF